MIEVPVLIAGGGPVGLTLGIDLAHRGQRSLLVENAHPGPTDHPKATLLGARSMEFFRRFGLDDAVYRSAIPDHLPYQIIFTTRLAKHELGRFVSPSIAEIRAHAPETLASSANLPGRPTAKPRSGSRRSKPVLLDHARSLPELTMRTA